MKTIQEVIIHPSSEKNASYIYARIARNRYLQTFRRFGESFDYCRFCSEFMSAGMPDCPCGGREAVHSGAEMRRHIKEAQRAGQVVEITEQESYENFEAVLKDREKFYAREKKYVRGYRDSSNINVTFKHYDRYEITGFTDPFGEAQIKIVVEAQDFPLEEDKYISLARETYYCRVTGINNKWHVECDKFAVGKYWPTGETVRYPFPDNIITEEKAKKLAKWSHIIMRHGFGIQCLREGQNDGE